MSLHEFLTNFTAAGNASEQCLENQSSQSILLQ